jgi:hypothetical protein
MQVELIYQVELIHLSQTGLSSWSEWLIQIELTIQAELSSLIELTIWIDLDREPVGSTYQIGQIDITKSNCMDCLSRQTELPSQT